MKNIKEIGDFFLKDRLRGQHQDDGRGRSEVETL